jgi:hypothetical protein
MQVQNVRVETREVQNIFRKSGQCQLKGHHLQRGIVVVLTFTTIKSRQEEAVCSRINIRKQIDLYQLYGTFCVSRKYDG